MILLETYKNFIKDWDYDKPTKTRKIFLKHYQTAKAIGDTEFQFLIQTQIARTYSLELEFVSAHSLLDEVEKSLDSIQSPELEIRYYLERGRTYNSSKALDKAKECFLKAIEIANLHKEDFLEVDALHMMGIAEENPAKQVEWNEKAISIAESSTNVETKNWVGSLLNNTGWTIFNMKNYDHALEIFEKVLAFRKEEGKPEGIAIAMWCIARTLRSLNNIDQALELQLEIQKYRIANKLTKGCYNFEELGELYLLKNMKKESQEYFKEAYSILSQDKWLTMNEPQRLERIKQLAGN